MGSVSEINSRSWFRGVVAILIGFGAIVWIVRIANDKPEPNVGAGAIRVGVVFDKGGKDDRSFNAAAWRGLQEAVARLGIDGKSVEAMDDNAYEPALRTFARKKFDLIIGVGFAQAEPIARVALEYPQQHFAIVDGVATPPNVRSLVFGDHEGAFLAGVAARMKSRSGMVGFIGGMDVPLIRRFARGYIAGVQHVAPRSPVAVNFVGITADSWNNPPKAKELAFAQFGSGVDVIYTAAGGSNSGVFDAVTERPGKFAIGTDSNQNGERPGFILTSILKKIDVAVFDTIAAVQSGAFTAGVAEFGISNGGIDYAIDRYNDKILDSGIRDRLDLLKKEIIKGSVLVPDYYRESQSGKSTSP